MEILFKSVSDLISDKLSILQRGILITILLLKEDKPKITLAKFRAEHKFDKALKEELIHLHENKFIKWSGYNAAKKSINKVEDPRVAEVIDFMNKLYGRRFDSSKVSQTKNLKNRLQDHSVEDIKKVVVNRYEEWKDDPFMKKYLKPTTIFRPSKFDGYLEEALHSKKGSSLITVEELNIEDGDEITNEHVDKFLDKDLFNILIFKLDDNGKRRGHGGITKRTGKDLKNLLSTQKMFLDMGRKKEFVYIYKK